MKRFLLIDNTRDVLVRYVGRQAVERYEITDRAQFDLSFTEARAEALRQGADNQPRRASR